ncbi:hypothetical protein BDW22DRAFT_1360850 [Trametopsis cervina]|nr:hypothetical protein BDW22DRAFT_1360850 [Trametopsis cervina]
MSSDAPVVHPEHRLARCPQPDNTAVGPVAWSFVVLLHILGRPTSGILYAFYLYSCYLPPRHMRYRGIPDHPCQIR